MPASRRSSSRSRCRPPAPPPFSAGCRRASSRSRRLKSPRRRRRTCAPADCRTPRSAPCGRSPKRSVEGGLDLQGLGGLDAEDAHKALVAVKGVGPWTADIFLLFCLGHPDAFPAGDLALQEAAKLALSLKRRPDAAQARADRRTLAAAARRRRAHALGLLPGREGALGDGPRRRFAAKPDADQPWSRCHDERRPGRTPHPGGRRPNQPAGGVPARLRRRRQRPDRARAPVARAACPRRRSSRRTRPSARRRRRWAGNGSRSPIGRPTTRPAPTSAGTGAVKARGAIDAFLDAELERLGLDEFAASRWSASARAR